MPKKTAIAASFIVLGATSIGSQILILRELLRVFYGNELSIAIILGSWFILVSLGSLAFGRFVDRIRSDIKYFSSLLIVLSLAIPVSIFLCRAIKPALGLNPGEITGLTVILASSLVAVCAFCVPYGFLFALGCKIYARFFGERAQGVGGIFSSEALGSIVGGSVISLILINRMSPYQIVFLFSLLNLAFAFILSRIFEPKRTKFIAYLSAILLVISIIAWRMGVIDKIDDFTERLSWRPFRLLKSENSIYGNIAALSQGSQTSFYSSGLFLFSFPDRLGAEERIHYALLSHPEPKSVLLVGGGIGGALDELYKYNLTAVDYVELDPLLIKMAEEIIGEDVKEALENPILHIIEGDGRFHIKTARNTYDIIIISAPDPCTIQINRLYTLEFFKEAKKKLNKGGILSLTCGASENYIGPEMAEYLRSIYKTLKEAGFTVAIIPGETIRFLAADVKDNIPQINAAYFQDMLNKKGVRTHFVRDYYLNSKLSPERTAYAKGIISDIKYSSTNTDFKPISYYYGIILWTTYFQSGMRKILIFLDEKKVWYFIFGICLLIFLLYFKRRKNQDKAVFLAIGTTGFTEMAIQINLMLAFQIIYGYLYYKLGLIITVFMAGLFIGAYATTRRLNQIKLPLMALKKSKIILALLSLLLIPIFKILSIQTTPRSLYIGTNLIFPLLMFLTGVIGGMQFPIANKIILVKKSGVGEVAGAFYGADLIGGAAGALLVASIFIPLIGILQCLAAVGLLNLVSAIVITPDAPRRLREQV